MTIRQKAAALFICVYKRINAGLYNPITILEIINRKERAKIIFNTLSKTGEFCLMLKYSLVNKMKNKTKVTRKNSKPTV